jgi:hypothetical protein
MNSFYRKMLFSLAFLSLDYAIGKPASFSLYTCFCKKLLTDFTVALLHAAAPVFSFGGPWGYDKVRIDDVRLW